MPKVRELVEISIYYEELQEYSDTDPELFRFYMKTKNRKKFRQDLLNSYFAEKYNYYDETTRKNNVRNQARRALYPGEFYIFHLPSPV